MRAFTIDFRQIDVQHTGMDSLWSGERFIIDPTSKYLELLPLQRQSALRTSKVPEEELVQHNKPTLPNQQISEGISSLRISEKPRHGLSSTCSTAPDIINDSGLPQQTPDTELSHLETEEEQVITLPITEQLCKGNLFQFWKAYHPTLGGDLIVKTVSMEYPPYDNGPEARWFDPDIILEQVKREEAIILGQLSDIQGTVVPRHYGFYQSSNHLAVLMEFCGYPVGHLGWFQLNEPTL
ncbi:uncharacterized protein L201_002976 [Kwoniella dendrophila CBS 6074]|uniref:Uncharacterized protein n=1 Tax=Kwoniella dendrophila CBS 6074 TaxID=1295534 RepID=A0AAX4JRJ2_9TREE